MHQSEIDAWHRREALLERRLERERDRVDKLSEKLAEHGGDDDGSQLETIAKVTEAARELVPQMLNVFAGRFGIAPGAGTALGPGGDIQPGATLPLPAQPTSTFATFLASYVALDPFQSAQLVYARPANPKRPRIFRTRRR